MKQIFSAKQHHANINWPAWDKYGFIPSDVGESRSASKTLEICWDAWALSNMAQALGFKDDYNLYYSQSKGYQNIWNKDEKIFCPKTIAGQFDCPPTWTNIFDERYVEGDAWHYRFFVPGDPEGLIKLFGEDDFVSSLDTFMYLAEWDPFTILANPYYWAGNEPSLLASFLFNFVGRLDLNSRYVWWLKQNRYTPNADGLPGNDDYGTMSAWYLWTSFGLYPLAGGKQWLLTSPAFEYLSVDRPGGKLQVTAHNFAPTNFYITRATINGKDIDLKRAILEWEDIRGPTDLQFWMSSTSPHKPKTNSVEHEFE